VTALAGFWSTGGGSDPPRACERMLKAQAVYAPAAPVTASLGDVALGRRLFALLPEDRFDRGPVTGGGGRWTLLADVRLADRDGLADSLGIARGEAARLSDAAFLMRAWEQWEEAVLERVAGDFAFALWDRDRERLVLARDALGQRPLHFHRGGGFFAFASMPKGLHALPEIPREPDEGSMRAFLALLPEEGSRSFFAGVERVPPGHLAVVTRSGLALRRYWDPPRATLRLKRREEYDEAVREGLDRAVRSCLRGVGSGVATHLSGGLDSSAVTATAARQLAGRGRVAAFTAVPREGFDDRVPHGRFADEGAHAAALAALYPNIDHELVRSGRGSPFEGLDRYAFLFERPALNLCNMVWVESINAAAKRRGLAVLLVGQMGNMSFSYTGFERLSTLLRRGRLVSLAREAVGLRRQGIRLVSVAANTIGPYLPRLVWLAINRRQGRSIADLAGYSAIDPAAAEAAAAEAAALGFDLSYRPSRDSHATRLRVMRRVDPGNYTKGTLAGWGVDTRDPTADRRLIELCLSIPDDQYLRGGRMRALARDAFADRLPADILNESRKGLQAADWYEGLSNGRQTAEEEVERLAALAPAQGLFDVARMRRLVAEWPEQGWNTPGVHAAYRLALLRGVSGGHFLRKAIGAN
jgi:asparagine synthase (glutamine-hydrolysing)